ncbi:hypothetical protein EES43_16315 [Streptomyces sp. ADI96-02]|nr:hypothetical protein EES43_16315 [Streptomyces sp. ADI96-02]
MLSHVIPPLRGYTKTSHELVRHPRLGSDAKILVIYVQGLPEGARDKALSEHARALRITGRAYQKAKAELVTYGYVHEKRETVAGGRWRTVQVFSNRPLTDDQAARMRAGVPADGYAAVATVRTEQAVCAEPSLSAESSLSTGPSLSAEPDRSGAPSAHCPAVGDPSGRTAGGLLPADEEPGENEPHPPPPAGERDAADVDPEVVLGERVLLSLRHERRELLLGVRAARNRSPCRRHRP